MAKNEYELIEYDRRAPFHMTRIKWVDQEDSYGNMEDVKEHWHPDLEIVYTLAGNAIHYIDGKPYTAHPGSIFIVNSESIHKVISDADSYKKDEVVALVLHIKKEFFYQMIPEMDEKYFVSAGEDNEAAGKLIVEISNWMEKISNTKFSKKNFDFLHILSLIYELMYELSKDRLLPKNQVMPINSEKNLERLRGIMKYVDEHYNEKIVQEEVAKRFYFTKEYFARFFKKNTGLKFMEYVTLIRLNNARGLLEETDETIIDIALDCGFSDARGFINAFKKIYNTTPLQYRKRISAIRRNFLDK